MRLTIRAFGLDLLDIELTTDQPTATSASPTGVRLTTTEPLPDRYRCGYCGQGFVVPCLARDHEAKHEADA